MTTEQNPIVTEDTSTPYVDAVKSYMEENGILTEETVTTAAEEQVATEAPQDETPQINNDLLGEDSADDDDDDEKESELPSRITLKTDTSFINDELENMSNLYSVTVKQSEYKITNDEKEAYLRCMLNDVPVQLTVLTAGSNIGVTCRSLSVYEIELATQAGIEFVRSANDQVLAEIKWRSEVQKYRLAMQMVKFQNEHIDYLEFKPEPGKVHEHIKTLREKADLQFGTMNIMRWRVSIHALNIFEHKLTRLNELALTPDFSDPGAQE